MTRILILPLVWVLSGLPAVAVVCDLLLCTDRAARAVTAGGCHDHEGATAGTGIGPRHPDCAHLVQPDPYLTSASREVSHAVAAAPAVESSFAVGVASIRAADPRRAHAPPGAPPATSFLPLRI